MSEITLRWGMTWNVADDFQIREELEKLCQNQFGNDIDLEDLDDNDILNTDMYERMKLMLGSPRIRSEMTSIKISIELQGDNYSDLYCSVFGGKYKNYGKYVNHIAMYDNSDIPLTIDQICRFHPNIKIVSFTNGNYYHYDGKKSSCDMERWKILFDNKRNLKYNLYCNVNLRLEIDKLMLEKHTFMASLSQYKSVFETRKSDITNKKGIVLPKYLTFLNKMLDEYERIYFDHNILYKYRYENDINFVYEN